MHPFEKLRSRERRLVAGLMSGTSLDGVDVAIAYLEGHGSSLRCEQVAFASRPFPVELRRLLLKNSDPTTSSVLELSQLNVRLAHEYAGAIRDLAAQADIPLDTIDLVGSHGQTVHHVPDPEPIAGIPIRSTLQIGDPSVLAQLLGIPCVGDFRLADMAVGGQGAPLVPYFDWVCFSDPEETRGLLNIGGIANITLLPAGTTPEEVFAFDTGPGNMVIDAVSERFFGIPFDEDGRNAAQGRIDEARLAELLLDPYFVQPPPKSTGRERFGSAFVDRLIDMGEYLGPHDAVATATALTAFSVYQAYARFIRERHALDVLIVSGGGMHNRTLMARLADTFSPIPVRTVEDYGIDSDAKEALCFAVLAHETVDGIPTGMPAVTGAERPAILGKVCWP